MLLKIYYLRIYSVNNKFPFKIEKIDMVLTNNQKIQNYEKNI